jgi:hypothetical protein
MAKAKNSECWCFYGWICEDHPDKPAATREEIEKRMEELAREYVQTRDMSVSNEFYRHCPIKHRLQRIRKRELN